MTPRIPVNLAAIIISFAVCVDIGQALIEWMTFGISDIWDMFIVDPIILGGLWLFFYFICKVNFTATRTLLFVGLGFLEFFPGVKQFPIWTADVVAVIMMTNWEDRFGKKALLKAFQSPTRQKKLRQGIMGAINRRTANNPRLQERLSRESGGKWDSNAGMNKQTGNLGHSDASVGSRQGIIAEQRSRKNAQNNEKV